MTPALLRLLPWFYAATAAGFMVLKILIPANPATALVKVLPALSLALAFLLLYPAPARQRGLLAAAALACAIGDVILDIDRVTLFVPGLAAFLLGHLGFLVSFALNRDPACRRRWIIPLFLLLPATIAALIFPRLDRLMLPVMVYLLVISAMTVLAILSRHRRLTIIGSILFVASDAMIALSRFVFDGQPSAYFSIPVYFTGLFLLAWGILKPRVAPGAGMNNS